jgi:hypothetical protein
MPRKYLLLTTILWFVCALTASAQDIPRSESNAPDLSAFLGSLQTTPKPVVRSACTVTQACNVADYGSISCFDSGGNCHSGPGWVQCGSGATQYCPVCYQSCCGEVLCYGWSSCTFTTGPLTLYCDGQSGYICRPASCK